MFCAAARSLRGPYKSMALLGRTSGLLHALLHAPEPSAWGHTGARPDVYVADVGSAFTVGDLGIAAAAVVAAYGMCPVADGSPRGAHSSLDDVILSALLNFFGRKPIAIGSANEPGILIGPIQCKHSVP